MTPLLSCKTMKCKLKTNLYAYLYFSCLSYFNHINLTKGKKLGSTTVDLTFRNE